MFSLLLIQAADGGLTLKEIVSDIPHDAAAIFVYLLLIGSVALVWKTGRAKSKP